MYEMKLHIVMSMFCYCNFVEFSILVYVSKKAVFRLQIIQLITLNSFILKIATLSKQNEQFQQIIKNQTKILKQLNEKFLLVQNQQKINEELKSGAL